MGVPAADSWDAAEPKAAALVVREVPDHPVDASIREKPPDTI
jgi:hypothetical protein